MFFGSFFSLSGDEDIYTMINDADNDGGGSACPVLFAVAFARPMFLFSSLVVAAAAAVVDKDTILCIAHSTQHTAHST